MKFLGLIEQLFAQYGYLVLLLGLPLDVIALPIPPGNTTMTYTGYLSYKGMLRWAPAMLSAWVGSIIGMTITYWIGYKLGTPIIERFGKLLFLKPHHLDKTRSYYEKFGNKLLLVSFFYQDQAVYLLLCRHYSHSIPPFALYAFTGSALWVVVFSVLAICSAISGRRFSCGWSIS